MKKIYRMITAALALTLLLSLAGCGSGDGKTHLVFQIWDVYQRPGMEAVRKAYTAQHPDVDIEVQVTSWSEYWTKLEAAAESNTMPDIFWMHTDQLLYYADFGMLADVTDLYDATGKYGFMAYNDDQLGYWCFAYQAGGHILTADRTRAGYTNPGSVKGIEFYVNMQKEDWCPTQTFFAETTPSTAFFSGMGAMYLEGTWNLPQLMENYPDMQGKWDIAKLPRCADPMEDGESLDKEGRATMSNGLCYATGAHWKKLEAALDVIKYFCTEEAQRIQGESGAAIPAYL